MKSLAYLLVSLLLLVAIFAYFAIVWDAYSATLDVLLNNFGSRYGGPKHRLDEMLKAAAMMIALFVPPAALFLLSPVKIPGEYTASALLWAFTCWPILLIMAPPILIVVLMSAGGWIFFAAHLIIFVITSFAARRVSEREFRVKTLFNLRY